MKKLLILAAICLLGLVPIMFDFSNNDNTTTKVVQANNVLYFNKITTNGTTTITSGKIVILPNAVQISELTGSATYIIKEIIHNEKDNTYDFIGLTVELKLIIDDMILWKLVGSDSTIYHINSTIKSNW